MAELIIISDYAGKHFATNISNKLHCNCVNAEIKYFPDDEADIQISQNIRGKRVYYVCPFYPDPMRRYAEILFTCSAMKYSSPDSITLVAPYMGFMKKDWKDKPRVPISIRTVAESIEPYAKKLITADMHSNQVQGMFRIPVDHLDASVVFARHIKETYGTKNIIITSPDIGAMKRTRKLSERLQEGEISVIYKLRNIETGDVQATNLLGDVSGKKIIFMDDQAVTLGSLCEAARLVKEKGAEEIYAYVTHGLMVKKNGQTAEERLSDSLIDKLYITDTIHKPDDYFSNNSKIELIPLFELFAEAIRRDFNNESVSELFF